MRVHAYVLAADPTWLRPSVAAYYPHVERIVVSYDESSRGWTGAPIRVEECLAMLRSLDSDGKMLFVSGRFRADGRRFLIAETAQRRAALTEAAPGADWILQIDTDEVLPVWAPLQAAFERAESLAASAVEWPMRVLFRRLRDGRYLEVAAEDGSPHFEYPAPIAVRAGTELSDCRRTAAPFLRVVVRGDTRSLQVRRPAGLLEQRSELTSAGEAIWHNSWARSPASVREKIASWGHNRGFRSWLYYYGTWLPAPLVWRRLLGFHPFDESLWPRLRVAEDLPSDLDA